MDKVKREFDNESDFINKYGYKYPKNALSIFYHCYQKAEIQQMFYATNKLEDYDIYESLVDDLIELGFDIGCNILDVASGYYPAFGYEIAGRQLQLNKGTVTCIDPKLVCGTPYHKNVKLIRDNFTKEYDLSSYDLIVSSLPCEVSYELFAALMNSNKDFFVYPCNCMPVFADNQTGLFWLDLYGYCRKYERENNIETRLINCKFFNNPYASNRAIIYRK